MPVCGVFFLKPAESPPPRVPRFARASEQPWGLCRARPLASSPMAS